MLMFKNIYIWEDKLFYIYKLFICQKNFLHLKLFYI